MVYFETRETFSGSCGMTMSESFLTGDWRKFIAQKISGPGSKMNFFNRTQSVSSKRPCKPLTEIIKERHTYSIPSRRI